MSEFLQPTAPSSNVARLSPAVWHVFASVLLVLITVFAYEPSLGGDWIADDTGLIVHNTCSHGIENIPAILRGEAGACNYRPLRYISYAIDYSIWGLNPWGYRLTNLLFHLGSVLLTYLLTIRLGLSRPGALFAAIVLALHPVQADAVAYISGRRDLLTGFWFFTAIAAATFIKIPLNRRDAPFNLAILAVCFAAGALSIYSKEMGVTVAPIVIAFLLLGGAPAIRRGDVVFGDFKKRAIPLLISGVPLLLVAGHMTLDRGIRRPVSTMAGSLFGETLESHVATVLATHARYVEMIFFPLRLPGDYSPPAIAIPETLFAFPSFLGAVWLVGLIVAALLFARRGWWREATGLAWYIVTMLPVSHIIPHHELAAEHYLYIPIFGLILAGVSLVERLITGLGKGPTVQRVALLIAFVITLALLGRTIARGVDFLDEYSHARATVRYVPESVRGNARAGISLLGQDRFDEAMPHLQFVLSTSFQGSSRTDVLRESGLYFAQNEEYELATRLLEEYMTVGPKNLRAIRGLGMVYFQTGNIEGAHGMNKLILQEAPEDAADHFNLALTAFRLQRAEEAYEALHTTLQRDSKHLDALLMAALLLVGSDKKLAQSYYDRASVVIDTTQDPVSEQQRNLIANLSRALEATEYELPATGED